MIQNEILEVHVPVYLPEIDKITCKFKRTPVNAIGLLPLVMFADAYNCDGEYHRHAFGACYHKVQGVPIYA